MIRNLPPTQSPQSVRQVLTGNKRHIGRTKLAKALETSEVDIAKVEYSAEGLSIGKLILMLELFDLNSEDFLAGAKKNLPGATS